MALQRLTITHLDGTERTVTPNLGDTLNFERTLKNNPRWGSLQENALKMQPFRAWSASKREDPNTATWEEWVESVADVTLAGDDDAEDTVDGLGKDTLMNQPSI
jgi:hypothetical protein